MTAPLDRPWIGPRIGAVKGALITVKCDCGNTTYLSYGENWECPQCRRSWNTTQIPAEEYWGVMRGLRRARLQVMAAAAAMALVVFAAYQFQGRRALLLTPLLFGFWYLMFMPWWRRRLRLQARQAPIWDLRPD